MFCQFCGTKAEDDYVFCTHCGARLPIAPKPHYAQPPVQPPQPDVTPIQPVSPQPPEPTAEQGSQPPVQEKSGLDIWEIIGNAFASKWFLIICIALTVEAATSFGVTQIIATISMWMLYSAAKKYQGLGSFVGPIRGLKVAATISYIAAWIASVSLTVMAVVLAAVKIDLSLVGEVISKYIDVSNIDFALLNESADAMRVFIPLILAVLVIYLVLQNIFFIKPLRDCADSFIETAETYRLSLRNLGLIKNWFMVLGIINAVFALPMLLDGVVLFTVSAASAVRMIFLSIWINKLQKQLNCE